MEHPLRGLLNCFGIRFAAGIEIDAVGASSSGTLFDVGLQFAR
jgi:hypothetical protein